VEFFGRGKNSVEALHNVSLTVGDGGLRHRQVPVDAGSHATVNARRAWNYTRGRGNQCKRTSRAGNGLSSVGLFSRWMTVEGERCVRSKVQGRSRAGTKKHGALRGSTAMGPDRLRTPIRAAFGRYAAARRRTRVRP